MVTKFRLIVVAKTSANQHTSGMEKQNIERAVKALSGVSLAASEVLARSVRGAIQRETDILAVAALISSYPDYPNALVSRFNHAKPLAALIVDHLENGRGES